MAIKKLNSALFVLLSNILVLRQKTHSFHWNVTGMNFVELHKLFQSQYEKLLDNADRLAEYMKTEEMFVPISLKEILLASQIEETTDKDLDEIEMIKDLYHDNKMLVEECRKISSKLSASQNILDTILADFGEYHSKQVWMLKSIMKTIKRN